MATNERNAAAQGQHQEVIQRKPAKAGKCALRASLLISLLACLVMTPATAGAEEFAPPNIGKRGDAGEGVEFECWGMSRPNLNPNGKYAYYVQDVDGIQDVCGWHNTNDSPSPSTPIPTWL